MQDTILRTWPLINGGFIAKFEGKNIPWQASGAGKGMTRDEAQKDLIRRIPRDVLFASSLMPFLVERSESYYPI